MKGKKDDFFLIDYIKDSKDFDFVCFIYNENDVSIQIVEDKKTKIQYVKKTFNFNDNKSIDYFRREVAMLKEAKIDGMPFLRFYGYNPLDHGESFLLTEYFENGSLEDAISDKFAKDKDDGKYDTDKMKIFYGIAFGLKYLHSRNIIHRDIKPENIFLNEELDPFIGDFGFARVFKEGIKITGSIGTIYYMAPEIIDEDSVEPDKSIDVYSFAITVLQTLQCSLTLEIDDGNTISIDDLDCDQFVKLVKEGKRYAEVKKVPDDFKEFITDCWSKDPQNRWTIDKILKMMKERKLFLKNCDFEKFSDYVNRLDEAFANHKHREEEEECNDDDYDQDDEENSYYMKEEEEEETKEFDFSKEKEEDDAY